jgi:hypothetical protein
VLAVPLARALPLIRMSGSRTAPAAGACVRVCEISVSRVMSWGGVCVCVCVVCVTRVLRRQ